MLPIFLLIIKKGMFLTQIWQNKWILLDRQKWNEYYLLIGNMLIHVEPISSIQQFTLSQVIVRMISKNSVIP